MTKREAFDKEWAAVPEDRGLISPDCPFHQYGLEMAAAIREADRRARDEQKKKDASVAYSYYEQPVDPANPNDDYETGAMDNALAIEEGIIRAW